MTNRLDALQGAILDALGERVLARVIDRGQLTIEAAPEGIVEVLTQLRDDPRLAFAQAVDLAGVDYSGWGNGSWTGPRYAVVYNLLSIAHNWRLRVKAFASDDDFPAFDSAIGVWPSLNWFEREAFDLYGIVFRGHPDLRRILTDYGFVGHPFRKDFPISGHVEMRYDPAERRVVYQPVTIEPREIVPRIVREEGYAEPGKK